MYRFSNLATALIAAPVGPTDTQILIGFGEGIYFPSILASYGDRFMLALEGPLGEYEIVECTERIADAFTVVRAREGTAAQEFPAGSRIELRLTAAALDSFIQKDEGAARGLILREPDGTTDHDVAYDVLSTQWKLAGSVLLNLRMMAKILPPGVIMAWSGNISNIPSGWALCNGSNGTPDLSEKFLIGASNTNDDFFAHVTGGTFDGTTGSSGAHDHGGKTGAVALTTAQMPAHTHKQAGDMLYDNGSSIESGDDYGRRAESSPLNETASTGGGLPHDHVISTTGSAHTHSFALTPPYYALCFIMRLSYDTGMLQV
jgi:hypothetical protein